MARLMVILLALLLQGCSNTKNYITVGEGRSGTASDVDSDIDSDISLDTDISSEIRGGDKTVIKGNK